MNPYIKYFIDKNITMGASNGVKHASLSGESPLYKTSRRHVFGKFVFTYLDVLNPCVCIVVCFLFGSSIYS